MRIKIYTILFFSLILTHSKIAFGLFANMPTKAQKLPVISEIIFKGNTVFSSREIKELMINKPNEPLDPLSLKRDIETISMFYHSQGYVMAKVSDVTLTSERKLIITINEGWLREVVIKGNKLVEEEVIRREFKPHIGKVYNTFAIREALSRVEKLDLFTRIEARAFPTRYGICLEVKVEERPSFWRLGSEVYYDLEKGYRHKFFLIKRDPLARKIEFILLMGKEPCYSLSFYNLGSFNFKVYITKERKGASLLYYEERKGIDIFVEKDLKERFSSKIQLRKEFISSFSETENEENFDNFSIIMELSKDTRNDTIFPSSGSLCKFSFQNSYLLSQGEKFNKVSWEADYFQKIWNYLILDTSLKIYKSWGDIPQCEWFHLGEKNIIHGYKEYELWGKQLFIFNLNLRIPLASSLQGVVSLDIGSGDNLTLRIGGGIGLKYLLKDRSLVTTSYGTNFKGKTNYYLRIKLR